MATYMLYNKSESTVEIIVPSYKSITGHDTQVLIPRSQGKLVTALVSDVNDIINLPRVKNLVARNILEVIEL